MSVSRRPRTPRILPLLALVGILWSVGAVVYLDSLGSGDLEHRIESRHLDDCFGGHNHSLCDAVARARALPASYGGRLEQPPTVAVAAFGGESQPVVSRSLRYRLLPRSPPSPRS